MVCLHADVKQPYVCVWFWKRYEFIMCLACLLQQSYEVVCLCTLTSNKMYAFVRFFGMLANNNKFNLLFGCLRHKHNIAYGFWHFYAKHHNNSYCVWHAYVKQHTNSYRLLHAYAKNRMTSYVRWHAYVKTE